MYVEHDLDDSESEMAVVEYLTKWFGEKEASMGVDRDAVVKQLNEVGFPEDLQVRQHTLQRFCVSLTGFWESALFGKALWHRQSRSW